MSHNIKSIATMTAKALEHNHIYLSGYDRMSPMVFDGEVEEQGYRMTMDSAPSPAFNDQNNDVLSYQVSAYLNTFIKQITQQLAFDEIAKPLQQGNFETETIIVPTMAYQGYTTQYGDYTTGGQAGFTPNFPSRQVYRLQTTVQYGDLEVATWSAAKIDAISEKRQSAVMVMNQDINTINFYGIQQFNGLTNKKVYGLLSDPNLLPAIASTVGSFNNATALQIIQQIQFMYNNIVVRSSNRVRITNSQRIILVMAPQTETYFMTPNTLMTNSVLEYLKAKLFPKLEIVTAIQYSTSSTGNPYGASNIMQMIIPEIMGQQTVRGLFTYKFRAHRVEVKSTSISQVFSESTGGSLLTMPFLVETATGV